MSELEEVVPVVHLAHAVRALWWIPVAAAVVGLAAGFVAAERGASTYQSTATVTLLIHPLIWHTNLSLYKPVDPGAMDHELLLVGGVEADRAVARRLGVAPATVEAAVTAVPAGGQSLTVVATSTDRSLVFPKIS